MHNSCIILIYSLWAEFKYEASDIEYNFILIKFIDKFYLIPQENKVSFSLIISIYNL
jgi:hypothetical protein